MTSNQYSRARRRFLGAATAASSMFLAARAAGISQVLGNALNSALHLFMLSA